MTDVSGIPLSPALIRGYLLELMEPDQPYKREDLQVSVTRKRCARRAWSNGRSR
jgi:hypothetical protein